MLTCRRNGATMPSHRGGATVSTNPLVGREEELGNLTDFVESLPFGPSSLVIEGEPGIGKTRLWSELVSLARDRGVRVLSCRPSESDSDPSFLGLIDLLRPIRDEVFNHLPAPQRRALRVALLREEAHPSVQDWRALHVGVLDVLRISAGEGPMMIAIDDLQWLDAPSARALSFVGRRLEDEPLAISITTRTGDDVASLDLSGIPSDRSMSLLLAPLSIEELGRLIQLRLGERLPTPLLRDLHRLAEGNPFYSLEIARAALRDETVVTGHRLPIPKSLRDDIVRHRLAALPPSDREVMLAVSALSRPSVRVIQKALGPRSVKPSLDRAELAGVVRRRVDQVNFTHPLYASAIYADAARERRHEIHRRLADVVDDPEERARHLALAAEGPDPDAAWALEIAAGTASGRGAPAAAAQLSELALLATPDEDHRARIRRSMAAAEHHLRSGDLTAALESSRQVVDLSHPGTQRAEALRLKASVESALFRPLDAEADLAAALSHEGIDDSRLRCALRTDLFWAGLRSGRLPEALVHAREAAELAEDVNEPGVACRGFVAGRHARALIGDAPEDEGALRRVLALEASLDQLPIKDSSRFTLVSEWLWQGRHDEARSLLGILEGEARDRGDDLALADLSLLRVQLELREGDLDEALAVAGSSVEGSPDRPWGHAVDLAVLGAVHAARGDELLTRTSVTQAREEAGRGGESVELVTLAAEGTLELSRGHPDRATAPLERAAALACAMGIGEPGMVPFHQDVIEMRVAVGRTAEAEEMVEWLEARGAALDRAFALASAARGRGLLCATAGDLDGAQGWLDRALGEHERLPMRIELGRTLLAVGVVARRTNRRRAGREALERARRIFEGSGAAGWAERAAAELERISGRRAATGDLTPAERNVAYLAAAGRTNREIAETLFTSVRTVEGHLAHVYAKLGIRSRTELATSLDHGEGGSAP
jgi:DNA-binding CsgD family transcriptional regulator